MHIFHKWEPIYQIEYDTFLSEKVERKWERFRRCVKCGEIQEYNYDSQGGSWSYIGNERSEILVKKLKVVGGVSILPNSTEKGE